MLDKIRHKAYCDKGHAPLIHGELSCPLCDRLEDEIPSLPSDNVDIWLKLFSSLGADFFHEHVKPCTSYSIKHDDTDGNDDEVLTVIVTVDGDLHVQIPFVSRPGKNTRRFRTKVGGGLYPHVYHALVHLIGAIKKDGGTISKF